MSEPQPDEPKLVKPEELVSEERLEEIVREACPHTSLCHAQFGRAWKCSDKLCARYHGFVVVARAVLNELKIAAIVPYMSGPCHRGFKKYPYDKCPDLERAGCPYIMLPGCFFQGGAVLIRKPASRENDRLFHPEPTGEIT